MTITTTIAMHTKDSAVSLIRLRKLRGEGRYRFAVTPAGESENAYHQSFRITKVSNPQLLKRLDKDIRAGGASFVVRSNGRSYPVVAQSLTPNTTVYNWGNDATFIFSEDEDDVQTYATTGLDIIAIMFIVTVVAGVALAVIYDDDTSEVEAEAGDRGGGDDGGDGNGDGGGGSEEGGGE